MNRYKKRGWFNESHRHYLAAKGIKTTHDWRYAAKKKTWFEQQSPEYREAVLAEERYFDGADERYEKNVRGRKILHEGHDADLVAETPTTRTWVSRVTGELEEEKLVDGAWVMA